MCSSCKTHLSTNGMIISKQFTGRGGRAFLFDKVCVRFFFGGRMVRDAGLGAFGSTRLLHRPTSSDGPHMFGPKYAG